MITYQINQQRLRGGQYYPHKRLIQALRAIQKVLGKQSYEVSIAFVSPVLMRKANRLYRGKDRITDVLSFGLSEQTGELALSYEQAQKQAHEQGHSTRNEITFLIVHGMLHLLGYDHERPTEAKNMFALQEKILQQLGVDSRL